ncbi:hypothetical protein ACHAXN_006916 [Cyclotella atomus]
MSEPPGSHQPPHTDYYDTVDAINSSERSADEYDASIRSDHAQGYDETIAAFDRSCSVSRSDYGFDHHEYEDCHENNSIEPQQQRVERSYDLSTESSNRVSSHYESAHSYESSTSDQSAHYESEDSDDALENEKQYDQTDFPPGHITTLSEMEALQTRRKSTGSFNSSANSDNLNPSILPTYFFCPLTKCIMKDPVLTPDGNTYERLAIIRYLVLDPSDPSTGNPLTIEELRQDQMVKGKIEKCRREAWMRYVMEANKGDGNRFAVAEDVQSQYESSRVESEDYTDELNTTNEDSVDELDDSNYSRKSENLVLVNTTSSEEPTHEQFYHHVSNQNANLLKSNFKGILPADKVAQVKTDTSVTSSQPATNNMHGWNTPLGVHRITCKPPGLVVTADIHRRSAVVKRKVLKQRLVTKKNIKKRDDQIEIIESQSTPERGRNMLSHIPTKKKKARTVLTVSSQDLVLPPGSHVEIVETVVHGGRVRGQIVWQEEMIVELDDELRGQMKKIEGIGENTGSAGASNSKKKNNAFFRRKNSQQEKNPFSSDLFTHTNEIYQATKRASPSPPQLTLVEYGGWISLEWAEAEAMRNQRNETGVSDEDDGPWSQPLPLGVYRVEGDRLSGYIHSESTSLAQLPLSDAPDNDRNITHILVNKQCVEIVEIQVVVMTTKIINAADGVCGVRTVRARCMVPILIPPMIPEHVDGMRCVNARPQKKFKSGWISLCTDENLSMESNATPLPSGAYIVTSSTGCTVTEGRTGSKIKSILACSSCVEVVTTRIEFEEDEMIKCHCGRESMYSVVAVRALIASGGYLTLFIFPVSTLGSIDNVCYCGQLVQRTFADPVPIGMYKVTNPHGVAVTSAISQGSSTITIIQQGVCLTVLQTGVEDGCVRGRICLKDDCTSEPVTGWISLFKFPDQRWAQYFVLEE